MFWLRNKEICFLIHIFNLSPVNIGIRCPVPRKAAFVTMLHSNLSSYQENENVDLAYEAINIGTDTRR